MGKGRANQKRVNFASHPPLPNPDGPDPKLFKPKIGHEVIGVEPLLAAPQCHEGGGGWGCGCGWDRRVVAVAAALLLPRIGACHPLGLGSGKTSSTTTCSSQLGVLWQLCCLRGKELATPHAREWQSPSYG